MPQRSYSISLSAVASTQAASAFSCLSTAERRRRYSRQGVVRARVASSWRRAQTWSWLSARWQKERSRRGSLSRQRVAICSRTNSS